MILWATRDGINDGVHGGRGMVTLWTKKKGLKYDHDFKTWAISEDNYSSVEDFAYLSGADCRKLGLKLEPGGGPVKMELRIVP